MGNAAKLSKGPSGSLLFVKYEPCELSWPVSASGWPMLLQEYLSDTHEFASPEQWGVVQSNIPQGVVGGHEVIEMAHREQALGEGVCRNSALR